MGKILGIDLGTTKSAIAYLEGNIPEIILTPEGHRLLPSIVAFTATGERLVGQPAKSQMITNPLNTISSVKTLMGKKYSEVEPYLKEFSFHIIKYGDDLLRIEINNQIFSPEEISAMILLKLKEAADRHLSDPIDGVIITVPAYFNDSQRQSTKDAGTIAGLNVKRIINEPTAASLAYSVDMKKKAKLIVYDFGGGTIDISVLDVQNGVIKVLATAGNTHLGGNNFDIALTQKLTKEFANENHIDLANDKAAMQRIREAAENAKIELSAVDECEINLPFITESEDGPLHLIKYLRKSEFENLIKNQIEQTLEICARALHNANLRISDIDEFLLVGGSTRIPFVQQKVKEFFKKEPNRKVNPDQRRKQRHPAPGCHAAGTGSQDLRRGIHQDRYRQHHHSGQSQLDFFNRGRQPDRSGHSDFSRRKRSRRREQIPGKIYPVGHQTGPARRSAHRSDLQHQCQRHAQGRGHGSFQ
jgi:molecular chaperone DnaK